MGTLGTVEVHGDPDLHSQHPLVQVPQIDILDILISPDEGILGIPLTNP